MRVERATGDKTQHGYATIGSLLIACTLRYPFELNVFFALCSCVSERDGFFHQGRSAVSHLLHTATKFRRALLRLLSFQM